MSRYTPGPWRAVYDGSSTWSIGEDADPQVLQVASVEQGHGYNWDTMANNAQLLALAPELIDALHDCLDVLDNYADVDDGDDGKPVANKAMSMIQAIQALIKKARTS